MINLKKALFSDVADRKLQSLSDVRREITGMSYMH